MLSPLPERLWPGKPWENWYREAGQLSRGRLPRRPAHLLHAQRTEGLPKTQTLPLLKHRSPCGQAGSGAAQENPRPEGGSGHFQNHEGRGVLFISQHLNEGEARDDKPGVSLSAKHPQPPAAGPLRW